MVPPDAWFGAPNAGSLSEAVFEMIRSWAGQDLGALDREPFLDKLLDRPLHTQAFAGAALYGEHCLLVEQGMVLAAISVETGRVDPDAALPDRAAVRLYPAPATFQPGFVTLLASAFLPVQALQENLDSAVVDLPAYCSRLLARGFQGVLKLVGDQGRAALCLLHGDRPALMLLVGPWAEEATEGLRASWLGSVEASASVFERVVKPPAFWYPRGFGGLTLTVSPKASAASGAASVTLQTFVADAEGQDSLFAIRSAAAPPTPVDVLTVADSPAYQALAWSLERLPRLLIEQRRGEAWKYLADWLPLVRRARLYADLERPGTGRHDRFDFWTEDGSGKILHLGSRLATVDVDGFQAFVDRVVQAKTARTKQGDIGGVLLISKHFPAAVLEAYRALLHRGLGNRILGLDKSLGYDGFVRLKARRGFHLLLVEERDGQLKPRFVD